MLNTLLIKKQTVKSRFTSGKKIFSFLLAASFLAGGCGNGDDPAQTDVPAGMVAADLSPFGLPVILHVPDSVSGVLQITENPQGGADIKVGANFQMSVKEGPGDIAMMKSDISSDAVKKLVKYVVEDPNALVWEWQIEGMEPEFHCYAIVKAGDRSFEVRNLEEVVFSEKAATQMLDAAKSIRLKAPEKEKS